MLHNLSVPSPHKFTDRSRKSDAFFREPGVKMMGMMMAKKEQNDSLEN